MYMLDSEQERHIICPKIFYYYLGYLIKLIEDMVDESTPLTIEFVSFVVNMQQYIIARQHFDTTFTWKKDIRKFKRLTHVHT